MTDVSMQDNSPGESGTLNILDAMGQQVSPAQPPTWVADDNGAVIDLLPAADGMSAQAVPKAPGVVHVVVTAVDAEGNSLELTTAVTVTAGPEASLSVTWSPVSAPPPPPAEPPAPAPDQPAPDQPAPDQPAPAPAPAPDQPSA